MDAEDLSNTINQVDLIDIHYTQQLQNTHFFQIYTDCSPRQTICWTINKFSENFKRLKFSEVHSLTSTILN